MERKTRKEKKKGATCRSCWIIRFRKDLMKEFTHERDVEGHRNLSLPEFLNRELSAREDIIKSMREEFADLYDENSAIEHLAGDVYMGRYDKEKKED